MVKLSQFIIAILFGNSEAINFDVSASSWQEFQKQTHYKQRLSEMNAEMNFNNKKIQSSFT